MPIVIKLALPSLLVVAAATASAQDMNHRRITDLPGCDRPNASRLPPDVECGLPPPPPTVVRTEKELSTRIEMSMPVRTFYCSAGVEIVYLQRNDVASVAGEIDNTDCAASSGSYVIAISTRDENGELTTARFPRAWHRDDDRSVSFSDEFEIGENVDLVRARVLRLTCECDGT